MKKILTLFTALILFGSMTVQATYYVTGIGGWSATQVTMDQVGTSNVYSKSFDVGTDKVQFKVTDGSWNDGHHWGWSNAKKNLSNIYLEESGGNVSFTLAASSNVTIYFNSDNKNIYVIDNNVDYVTFFAGTTLYYRLTGSDATSTDKGYNIYNAAGEEYGTWKDNTTLADPIPVTLTNDLVISANANLFKSNRSSWNGVKCATLPTTGQNMIVSTDGATCHWATYPPAGPSVEFDGLPTNVYKGQTVTFAATSENVENPTYTFQVKKGEDEYGPDVTEYKFDEPGTYKVKVEVREEGASTVLDAVEQVVTCTKYSLMQNNRDNKGSEVAVFSSSNGSVFTATWNCASTGTYYFYATNDATPEANTNCDYLNADQTLADGEAKTAWLYGTSNYEHSYKLIAPRTGEYTFTLTLGSGNTFKCDYPEALAAEVSFGEFPANIYKGQELNLNNYVSSENVTTPAYTFYLDDVEIADPAHFSVAAAGSHGLKVEVREAGETGDALATSTTTLEIKTLYLMQTDGTAKGTQVEECATTDGTHFTASWTCSSSTDVYFYVTNNPASEAHSSCDYLGGGTLTNGTAFNAYLYGSSAFENAYKAAYKLVSPWDGEYVFTLTFNAAEPHSFKCDFPAEPEPVYTVAGSESAFGTNWKVDDDANKMTLDGGVYKLTKTDRTLVSGSIEFKVVKNHDYAQGEWPASNYQLAILEAGVYTIEITFDPANVGDEISATATKTGEAVVTPTITIDGSWDWGNKTTLIGDETSVSTTIHLDAGTHYFKMLVNGDHRSNGYYYHRDFPGAEGITSNADDMSLGADIAGDYTFTWTFETNGIEITFPEPDYSRNVTIGNYGTICLPNGGTILGAQLYDLEYFDGVNTLYLLEVEGNAMVAGKPYIFLPSVATIRVFYTDNEGAPAGSNNGLIGWLGNENKLIAENDGNYILYQSQYWFVNSEAYVTPNHAYIHMEDVPTEPLTPAPGAAPRRRVSMAVNGENAATGFENIESGDAPMKVMIEGALYILRGEKVYDATGRLVK